MADKTHCVLGARRAISQRREACVSMARRKEHAGAPAVKLVEQKIGRSLR